MNDREIVYAKLFKKYGERMGMREVMAELGIGSTHTLKNIPDAALPCVGGGRRGVKIQYLTQDVAGYILQNPPRKSRGYHVEMDAREMSRFFAKHRLNAQEKAGVVDAWNTALVYGDELANLDLVEVAAISGCDEGILKRLSERGVPLNPLQTGVFQVAA